MWLFMPLDVSRPACPAAAYPDIPGQRRQHDAAASGLFAVFLPLGTVPLNQRGRACGCVPFRQPDNGFFGMPVIADAHAGVFSTPSLVPIR